MAANSREGKFLFRLGQYTVVFLVGRPNEPSGSGNSTFRIRGLSHDSQTTGRVRPGGRCATGFVFEQRLKIRLATQQTLIVRRVTIALDQPTRDGDKELHLLSNVPKDKATAMQLAEAYRQRWTIEVMFLEMTETLSCEINTLGYPKAALFAFCLALQAYNAVSVIKASLRSVHGVKIEQQLSGYYLALEIEQMYAGMMVAIPPKHWEKAWGRLSPAELANVLKDLAAKVDLAKYQKTPRGPKKKGSPQVLGKMACLLHNCLVG
jgi:Transposase DDE domain